MHREIDHIVYCVPDLDLGIQRISQLFGVEPVIGGSHLSKGTKNALLNLGNKCYLEILAIDYGNKEVNRDRWMGIDMISESKITRWSLKSNDLISDSETLNKYDPRLSKIVQGSRKTTSSQSLSWQMILPSPYPEVELIPFMTDWSESPMHPTDSLEEGCILKSIDLYHPNPALVQPILSMLGSDQTIREEAMPRIEIVVVTPLGLIKLD